MKSRLHLVVGIWLVVAGVSPAVEPGVSPDGPGALRLAQGVSKTSPAADRAPAVGRAANKKWQVFFSPHGGCTEAVVGVLGKARTTVLVQAYSFTSAPIAKALVEAYRRGVKVQVVLDKSQRTEKYSSATFLYNHGIPTAIDPQHAIAHNKVMVIDGQTVITGSFNFTEAAEDSNAENLLVIADAKLAGRYTQNWNEHRQHSDPYTGLGAPEPLKRRAEKR